MQVADTYLGSVEDTNLSHRLEQERTLTVTLTDTERRRSRIRTTADDGTDLGIIVSRELSDGDVLQAGDTLVVVSLDVIPTLTLDFATVDGDVASVIEAVAFGYAIGNRHWSLAVDETCVYLSITGDRKKMEREVQANLPENATIGYQEVSPVLFDDTYGPDHSHDSGGHGNSQEGKSQYQKHSSQLNHGNENIHSQHEAGDSDE